MQALILFLSIVITVTTAFSAENILKSIGKPSGFFLIPEFEETEGEGHRIDDRDRESLTLRGGVVLSSQLGVGAFITRGNGPSTTNNYTYDWPPLGVIQVVGVTLQYFEDRLWPSSPFSLRGDLAVGAGQHHTSGGADYFNVSEAPLTTDNFAVYEATIYPQLELLEPFYLSIGFGYRWVQGFTQDRAENEQLSGVQTSVALTYWLPKF